MIAEWIHEIIDGVGGLHDFEKYEIATANIPRDEAVATWVIRCLGNTDCIGSDAVLKEIKDHRGKQDISKIVHNLDEMKGLLNKSQESEAQE